MKRAIQYSFYTLGFALPIATLLSQFFLNRLGLPSFTVLWKEILVAFIIGYTLLYILKYFIRSQEKIALKIKKIWPILALFSGIAVVGISSMVFSPPLTNLVFGFRFELFWVVFFAVVVSYNNLNLKNSFLDLDFYRKLKKSIYYGFYLVLFITVLQIVFGQQNILGFFGFGEVGNEFLTKAPLAHVIDGGGINDSLRLSGTFSTPNHFAAYLLLVGGLFSGEFIRNKRKKDLILIIILTVFIVLSFARFSWLGVLMSGSFGLILVASKRIRFIGANAKKVLLLSTLAVPVFIGVVAINLPYENLSQDLPSFLSKPSSTILHRRHTMTTLEVFAREPNRLITGFGLGISGPGAKGEYSDIYENPLVIKYGSDIPYKNFLVEKDILIPENWFLQVLVNGGFLYLVFYCLVVFIPLWFVLKSTKTGNLQEINYYRLVINLSLVAIIIGNLFLHLWENQTVAFYWTIIWLLQFDINSSASLN